VREMYQSGELQRALGLSQAAAEPPKISITDAGVRAIRAAQRNAGQSDLHLAIDARFQYRMGFGAQQPGEVAAESNGIRVWFSPESAQRADGLTIDAAETPQGLRISIDNPNEPTIAQLSATQLAELRASGTPLELIDVREPDERAKAQIQGARPLDEATATEARHAMPLTIAPPPQETIPRMRAAIEAAIPGARAEVRGSGTHFEIRVIASAFEGKNTLARQRMVYAAIADLMKGDGAPVHAIDRMETEVP
jgi:acid stress-induced BolA-like protein IbaG/YrbA/Fe-S cluster assembly iron-binding protein IscA